MPGFSLFQSIYLSLLSSSSPPNHHLIFEALRPNIIDNYMLLGVKIYNIYMLFRLKLWARSRTGPEDSHIQYNHSGYRSQLGKSGLNPFNCSNNMVQDSTSIWCHYQHSIVLMAHFFGSKCNDLLRIFFLSILF